MRPRLSTTLLSTLAAGCAAAADTPARAPVSTTAKASPSCVTAGELRARAPGLVAEGRLDRANRAIERAARLCPSNVEDTWALHVTVLAALGRADEARALADTIEKSAKAPPEARSQSALAQEALAAMERPSARGASAGERLTEAGKALTQGRYGDAKRAFLDAWSPAAPSPHALYWAGHSAKMAGDPREAQRLFDRAMSEASRVTGEPISVVIPGLTSAPGGATHTPTTLAFSADARFVAQATNSAIAIRDRRLRFSETARLDTPGPTTAIAFSTTGDRLVACGSGWVRQWTMPVWKVLHELEATSERLLDCAISRDGGVVAQTHDGVEVLDVGAWTTRRLPLERGDHPERLALSPDGRQLAALDRDLRARLFDVPTGTLIRVLDRGSPRRRVSGDVPDFKSLAFSPDGHTLAVAGGGSVRAFDTRTGRLSGVVLTQPIPPLALAFSPDGKAITAPAHETTLPFVDLQTSARARAEKAKGAPVDVAFSRDGQSMAIASREGYEAFLQIETHGETYEWGHSTLGYRGESALWLSADGQAMVSYRVGVDTHGQLTTTTLAPHSKVAVARAPGAWLGRAAIAPDAKTIAWTDRAATAVTIWDVARGAELRRVGRGLRVESVAYSPDGRLLASGDDDPQNAIHLWSSATGAELHTLRGHEHRVSSLAFSPDGRRLASAASDATVRIWDVETGNLLRRLDTVRSTEAVAFSPDGSSLAAFSFDERQGGTVQLWAAETGIETGRWSGEAPNDRDRVALAFSSDGKAIIWTTHRHLVIADVEHKTAPRLIAGNEGGITSMRRWPGGRTLLSAGLRDVRVRAPDGAEIAVIGAAPSTGARYVVTLPDRAFVEIIADDIESATRPILCRAGALSFPFELCRERVEVRGLLARVLREDASYADP